MKIKILKAMNSDDRKEKIEELKVELVKSKVNASKTGGARSREIRKTIARIITLEHMATNNSGKNKLLKSKISRGEHPSANGKFASGGEHPSRKKIAAEDKS